MPRPVKTPLSHTSAHRHDGRFRASRNRRRSVLVVGLLLAIIAEYTNLFSLLTAPLHILQHADAPVPAAKATYQFTPTSGVAAIGTEQPITSATAASNEGVNLGSWKGTLADDNFHWAVASTAGGIDMELNLNNVQLNGGNKMIIQTEIDEDATLPALLIQICDWVSSTSVDAQPDDQCTTGGWRTLNTKNASQTAVAYSDSTAGGDQLQWHVYDGYWSTGTTGGAPISTPLANFIQTGTNQVKIRYFSTTNTTSVVSIDFLRILVITDSVYSPAGFTNLGSGTPAGQYGSANVIGNSATGQLATTTNDAVYLSVPGTAGTMSDFYLSFKNVQTYEGMNTIYVKADYSCSAAGISHRPKIYNFTTSSWEDLTTASIACSTTDATNAWAKNNVTIADYISNGEIRVGWRGLANGTQNIRLDLIYVMVGSTNADTAKCEVSFGTGTATNCTNARTLDGNATASTFDNPAEDESTSFGHTYYAMDNDGDANVEEATSSNIGFPVTVGSDMAVVGLHYAGRFAAGTAGATALTVQMGLDDLSGMNQATGGWTAIGATSNSATQVYTDSITALAISTYGLLSSPDDYIDTADNLVNIRLRTTASGTSTTNTTTNWDFAMVSLQWIQDANHPTKQYQFDPTSDTFVIGTQQTITSATAASNEGVNLGGWRGTLADDNFHWAVASTAGGIDMQLNMDGVQLNGANKMIIQTEIDEDATLPALLVQICDWVSPDSVDAQPDDQCTTGGWRTLNTKNASQTAVAYSDSTAGGDQLQWHIYDGYWSTGTTGGTPISTPLSNFIKSGSKQVKIRYFSTTNTTSVVSIDFLRIMLTIDSVYSPAGFTNLGSGTPVGHYGSANVVGNSATAQLSTTTNDAVYLAVPGTAGSIADFYLSFKGVKTYTGMNSIYVKADYSCSASGLTHRPKIYNFTTSGWEDLTTASIACSTSDATNAWAKNNVTIADYVSNGEVRIGWYGLSTGTKSIRLDLLYIMLGTTNSDSSLCEVSFGTGTATNCTNTQTLDGNAAASTFDNPAEDESTSFGHTYYAMDNDGDANVEEATSSNIDFGVTAPPNAAVVGLHYAGRFAAGTPGTVALTVQMGLDDHSGMNQATGGWTAVGATSNSATQVYTDSITALAISTYGLLANPEDYVDTQNNRVNLRLRTTASGTATANTTTDWDFAMVSLQWIETGASSGSLTTDIVDTNGDTVASPSLAMQNAAFSFLSQSVTGVFGATEQKIRVSNTTGTPTWTLSIAATSPTAVWDSTGTDYDFNDPTADAGDGADADALGGQMTVDPSVATVAPLNGCSETGLTKGTSTGFSEGVSDTITLITAGTSAETGCSWDVTGVGISQTIPEEQPVASDYNINMTVSIVAS